MLSAVPPLFVTTTDPSSSRGLPGALSDELTEALLAADDPVARSETVCRLVYEMFESAAWLGDRLIEGELASLRGVLDAATAHHVWISERTTRPGPVAGFAS